MSDLSIGDLLIAGFIITLMLLVTFLVFHFSKKTLTKDRFFRFLGILLINMSASLIPFGLFGMLMGFPSVLVSSILVSLFLDKDKK
jgi:hypothetical protein